MLKFRQTFFKPDTPNAMNTSFDYMFPAIRGIQAGREYYTSMCPLKLIPKLFIFDDEELQPELRAQRTLNTARVPVLTQYLVENRKDYVLSSITVSINGKVIFQPFGSEGEVSRIGVLKIDMNSQFVINDGQHRRAAIQEALKKEPRLGDETISVVFFIDRGLERSQQMFADLNRHAVKPSKSLGLMYDHRDETVQLTKRLVIESPFFSKLVEMEKTSLSQRSRKLFTLSAIHSANLALIQNREFSNSDDILRECIRFWRNVSEKIKEWQLVKESKITSGDVRQDFVHCHAILLQALGVMGNKLSELEKSEQEKMLKKLQTIDWSRANAKTWEGRAMIGGRMQKASNNITLTANYLKRSLGLELSADEQRIEDAFMRGEK